MRVARSRSRPMRSTPTRSRCCRAVSWHSPSTSSRGCRATWRSIRCGSTRRTTACWVPSCPPRPDRSSTTRTTSAPSSRSSTKVCAKRHPGRSPQIGGRPGFARPIARQPPTFRDRVRDGPLKETNPMQDRTFGPTGSQVSEIAFGGWQLGGDWGAVDDDASIRTLHHAFERGINFVDTAELYGAGHSEEVIGRALQQWSGERIYVATKVQPTVWPDPDQDDPEMRGRYPRWHLRNAVDQALRRLQVERLDVLQLHGWLSSGVRELDWLETLNELIIEGKVEYAGVSIRDYRPDAGVDIAKLGLVASIQVMFNLFE